MDDKPHVASGTKPTRLKPALWHTPFVEAMRAITDNHRWTRYQLRPFDWFAGITPRPALGTPRPQSSYRAARREKFKEDRRQAQKKQREWAQHAKTLPEASAVAAE